jgi:hypothetical protein
MHVHVRVHAICDWNMLCYYLYSTREMDISTEHPAHGFLKQQKRSGPARIGDAKRGINSSKSSNVETHCQNTWPPSHSNNQQATIASLCLWDLTAEGWQYQQHISQLNAVTINNPTVLYIPRWPKEKQPDCFKWSQICSVSSNLSDA